MPVDELIEQIFNKPKFSMKPGLERIAQAYEFLNKPLSNTPTILIAGTNGKGTTSSILYQLIAQTGAKTVLFNSPHLLNYSERFISSHEQITDEILSETIKELKIKLPKDIFEKMSFFEITTILALYTFEKLNPDYAILEVGLGGKQDCTNIVNPIASVITSIGIDHTEQLGTTIKKITNEKLGICRDNVPLFIGQLCPEAKSTVKKQSNQYKRLIEVELKDDKTDNYLQQNSRLACQIFDWLEDNYKLNTCAIGSSKLAYNLPQTSGRFDLRKAPNKDISILFDVCHNPNGARKFKESYINEYGEHKSIGLISIFQDKDIKQILEELEPLFDQIIFFSGSSIRNWKKTDVPKKFMKNKFFNTFAEAWKGLFNEDIIINPVRGFPSVTISGSVHMVGDAFKHLKLNTDIDFLKNMEAYNA